MFTQFRIHYPKGSLVTELLTIDHGKYVVRCLVQNEGTTLVTGLAAADSVELAEDRARTRALDFLGIDHSAAAKQPETPSLFVTNHEVSVLPQLTPIASTAFSDTPSVDIPMRSELVQPQPMRVPESTIASDARSLSSLEPKREEVVSSATTTPSVDDEISFTNEFDSTEIKTSQDVVETPLWMAEKESSTPFTESPVASYTQQELETDTTIPATATPVDFSDIIARTNVELKRLGWTNQQGRDYLVQTYGKRSRQLLTDAELLDFLHHLESEPSPQD